MTYFRACGLASDGPSAFMLTLPAFAQEPADELFSLPRSSVCLFGDLEAKAHFISPNQFHTPIKRDLRNKIRGESIGGTEMLD